MYKLHTHRVVALLLRSIIGLLLCALPSALCGQTDDIPQFNCVRTPVSPAFTLLDAAPAAVERPNTPSALAVSILANSAGLTKLPTEYSLEISPYWLFNHPTLTWQEDAIRSIDESMLRTLAISVGTVNIGDSSSDTKALAFGIRASLFSGVLSDRSRECLNKAIQTLTSGAAEFAASTALLSQQAGMEFTQELILAGSDTVKQKEAARKYNATMKKINDRQGKEFEQDELQDYATERTGFFLDVAIAGAWQFSSNKADSGKFMRLGVWLTPAYKWEHWSVVGVGRFLRDTKADSTTHVTWDIGASVIYTTGEYGLSLEVVDRMFTWEQAPKDILRLALVFDAEVNSGTWITATLGRTYTSGAGGSLLANLGLAFNINPQRYHF